MVLEADLAEPRDLHARVLVLESHSKRHDEDIGKIWGKVSALEICAASLPGINENLSKISAKVESLTACAIKGDGQRLAYLTIREWVIVAIALTSLYLSNFR